MVLRENAVSPNYLRFRISPELHIALGMTVMSTGEHMTGEPAEMLASHHPGGDEMDAYERVLGEAIAGDATLFAREDYVEEAWRIVDPVLKGPTPLYEYEANTWGPSEVETRITPAGGWQNPILEQETVEGSPQAAD
jgi:glucose-6-phosphate 1-dehydrogenase